MNETTDNATALDTPVDNIRDWVSAYRAAKEHEKKWAEVAERAKEHITAELKRTGATVGTINGQAAVRWSIVEGSRLDTKKLRAELPDIADRFTVPTMTRRFTTVDGE